LNVATTQPSASDIQWPPTLRAELDSTPAPRRAWYLTVGPAYLTIFVWAPFFDPLWAHDIRRYGLFWLAGSAVVAAVLCYGLFYYPAAMWGFRTGRRLGVVAASTFGTAGSDWLTGVAFAVAEIVWYAVAIDYAVQATFLGLVACGLLPPGVLASWPVGPALLRNPVFLATAVFWIFITGMASLLRLTAVIAALMKVYSLVALVLLTIAASWALPGLSGFPIVQGLGDGPGRPDPPRLSAIPIFTGFFSLLGLMSLEWGAASARRRDVVVGGLIGIVLAGTYTAVMSLVVVAGAVGRLRLGHPDGTEVVPALPKLSFRWGVINGVGGIPAAVVLILLGLAALAPACYSSFVFVRKLFARWPRIRRVDWTWIGCTLAFFLIVTGWPGRLEAVDHVMGIVFAPAAGAMAGDYLRQGGEWAGVRKGLHPPGILAWALGVAIRPILDFMAGSGRLPLPALIASPIAGFLVAALTYWVLARSGWERPACPVETTFDVRDRA
jgi:cytosine permease